MNKNQFFRLWEEKNWSYGTSERKKEKEKEKPTQYEVLGSYKNIHRLNMQMLIELVQDVKNPPAQQFWLVCEWT